MRVYVVVYTLCDDGAIYEGVFSSEEDAEYYIVNTYGYRPYDRKNYSILEEEI